MGSEFAQLHDTVNGVAVADYMQIGFGEIDALAAGTILDVGIADIPFGRYYPVEHRGSRGDFVHDHIDLLAQNGQGVTDAVARDAATYRKQTGGQGVNGKADVCRCSNGGLCPVGRIYHVVNNWRGMII